MASQSSDTRTEVALSITPDFHEVRRALREIRAGLSPVLDDDPMTTIEIVGAEILNNVVEHGFAGRPADTPSIEVSACVTGQSLRFRVVDDGRPMPGGTLPKGQSPEIDSTNVFALPEGGFGWGLIRTLSGDLSYAYVDGKNRLEVSIDF